MYYLKNSKYTFHFPKGVFFFFLSTFFCPFSMDSLSGFLVSPYLVKPCGV